MIKIHLALVMTGNPFDRIDNELRKDAGCTTELDYIEQSSWLLFLKYLDSLENDRKLKAELKGENYEYILEEMFRWETWAAPKTSSGKINYDTRLIGDDLIEFVRDDLFPYLSEFKHQAQSSDTIKYKIGEIFSEIKLRIQYGKTLANVIDFADEFEFGSDISKHEMSQLYEEKIKRMGNAGRNGGEYYTPRPLIRSMIQITAPKIGETIYDGAVGSAGFLCEAKDYLDVQVNSTDDMQILQKSTFYGKEKKALAYVIGIMNMILHGIDAPNIIHTNTLGENIIDIQEKDRHNVVLANPPFGGKERKEIQQNFPIRTGETAYLFMQHFIKMLKAGGRGSVVIKNTFLSNSDNASVALRKELLESCNLHTILDCPSGTFQGAGVKTVVLFFNKGSPTRKIWYYQLNPGRNMGKTNPLNDKDMAEFLELQKNFADSENSWTIDIEDVDTSNYDLSTKNPNAEEEAPLRSPTEILDEIEKLDEESREILKKIRALL
jgi:type I restriction enzyme M protein